MKRLCSAVRHKLAGSRGESITEVLVAVLISSVALVMLASMIATSARLIQRSKNYLGGEDGYYARNNVLSAQTGTALTGRAVMTENVEGVEKPLKLTEDWTSETSGTVFMPIVCYVNNVNDSADTDAVLSYKKAVTP
jgi:hypothetical protein